MKKILFLIICVFLITGMAAFAGGKQEETAGAAEESAETAGDGLREVTVGLSWNVKDDALIVAWEDYMVAYSEEHGRENGLDINWIINVADRDPSRQNANIEDLIVQDVDLIITRAEDGATIGSAVKAARDAGIPVITFDRESKTHKPNAHVGGDGFGMAYEGGKAFAEFLEEKGVFGKVIELHGDMKDQNAIDFHDGWAKAEEEFEQWETIVTIPTEWKPEKYESGLTNALQSHPEANAIYIHSDFAMDAVRAALEKAGKWKKSGEPGHMWTYSNVAATAALPAIEEGYIDVTGVWDAYYHARKAVEVMVRILNGEKMDDEMFKVPGRVVTPETVNTLENLWSRDYAN